MKSETPKVLHAIAGRPLIYFSVRAALDAGCEEVVVVVGHGKQAVADYLEKTFGDQVKTAVQQEQRGSGDAAWIGIQAMTHAAHHVVLWYGDAPLVSAAHLLDVVACSRGLAGGPTLAMATCLHPEPFGYGRVIRNTQGNVICIREEKDLTTDRERAIQEVNVGIYVAPSSFFRKTLPQLKTNNAQRELYLTDIVALGLSHGFKVVTAPIALEAMSGVNDRHDLAQVEQKMFERIANKWRLAGVSVQSGAWIEEPVVLNTDCMIAHGAVLRGNTTVGKRAKIEVGSVLFDTQIGDEVVVYPYSVLEHARVERGARIGPFARLRLGSVVEQEAQIGNFVETKNIRFGKGSKANHLAYLGDGIVGEDVNIGAGTIFCNYDGFSKHTTVIEKRAFIGSDSHLIAPVQVGEGAYVGTGTTVTKDVPPGALAISRVPQQNKEGCADRIHASRQSHINTSHENKQ
ncbi:UDP-N-acetylglucosamine diphosphorylase/glucosamine-1-phosphate N-acetyltransferase [Pajaroellobacter abortibovis]|uniref:Bifunctional protein GlmU n=2 Tax=Pajaroellobacter abortibovis TaxID=1882918 RepID=A0A1L6MZK5_9BACT|nr:UDP-N-acetylglucosamine diphosphorylase/glucosamine-1-phosphate N-acetyltransferase [Pajaroellobacter abortibovis]